MPAPSQEFIIAALKRSERRDDGTTQMGWRSADGRAFGVTLRNLGLHLYEFEPNGRMVLEGADGEDLYATWDGHAQAFGDPNGYMAAARAADLDPDNFVMIGSGYHDYTLYYATLDEVATAIRSAVDENRRHDDVDRAKMADREFRRSLRRRYERERIAYGLKRAEDHRQAVSEAHGLFKGLHSMFGPLSKDIRDDIMSFMNAPSVETWSQVANYVINGAGMTMWGAWSRVDGSAPRSIGLDEGWTTFPDPAVMREAMIAVGSTAPADEDAGWMYRGPRR
jgi:hypothetical protein